MVHRLPNEYSYNYPKCRTLDCKELHVYTYKSDNYPLRCETHKLIQDKNDI